MEKYMLITLYVIWAISILHSIYALIVEPKKQRKYLLLMLGIFITIGFIAYIPFLFYSFNNLKK